MGWDAFGLPAENAAIERGIHPAEWTTKNIAIMKEQMNKLMLDLDWSRVRTKVEKWELTDAPSLVLGIGYLWPKLLPVDAVPFLRIVQGGVGIPKGSGCQLGSCRSDSVGEWTSGSWRSVMALWRSGGTQETEAMVLQSDWICWCK